MVPVISPLQRLSASCPMFRSWSTRMAQAGSWYVRRNRQAFISYTWDNQVRASEIARRLRLLGWECWIDFERTKPGSSLMQDISYGVRNSDVLVEVIGSRTDSSWMTLERALADQCCIPIMAL